MASNEISNCCTIPLSHGGQSTGAMLRIGNTHAYISEPTATTETGAAILFLTDGFGISNNAKLLADRFAEEGYFTIVPDLFEGDPFPDPRPMSFDLKAWLKSGAGGKGHLPDAVDPIVEDIILWLKKEKSFKKVGAVGYCFGGKYVLRYLREPLINVGFVAHPTNSTASELSAIQGPLSIAAAEHDAFFSMEKRLESEDLLRKNSKSVRWQINVYSGVDHGFAVRANREIRMERWTMDQCFEQASAWMKEHLDSEN